MTEIVQADTKELIAAAKKLFKEYAKSLHFDLCFQNFDQELLDFPVQYSPPRGRLFLALSKNQPIGCVALRDFGKGMCEMKRLYVRFDYRERKIGRMLAEAVINSAKDIGYDFMRLDTLPFMESANNLYKKLETFKSVYIL